MAHWTASAPLDADNKTGSSHLPFAAIGTVVLQISISARDIQLPPQDAGYTTASEIPFAKRRSVSTCGGSPYMFC
jgi:hypothetical protein